MHCPRPAVRSPRLPAGSLAVRAHEFKVERNVLLDAHYRADPIPVTDVLSDRPVERSRKDWTRVTATGTYAGEQLLVRNRPNNSVFGYEVLALLTLPDGRTVVVDRGWVENSDRGAAVAPAVAAGEVTVVGWVRPGETTQRKTLPRGQVASIAVPDVERAWDTELLDGYVVLDTERTAGGTSMPRPDRLEDPDRSLGPHQAYAFQWWMTLPLGLLAVVVIAGAVKVVMGGAQGRSLVPVLGSTGKYELAYAVAVFVGILVSRALA